MFWQEDTNEEHFTLPERIQEVSFKIQSKILPMDHSFLLAQALLQYLPWLADINAGIHDILAWLMAMAGSKAKKVDSITLQNAQNSPCVLPRNI